MQRLASARTPWQLLSPGPPCASLAPPRAQRQLSPRWQQLVCRDAAGRPDPRGQVWAAPYRWGCLLIAYRRDRLARWVPLLPL